MSALPSVIFPLTLPELLQHALAPQPGSVTTTLVICSSRDAFLQHLVQSLQHRGEGEPDGGLRDLTIPSLHNISATRHVKLAFCASVPALLAHLAAYGRGEPVHGLQCGEDARLVLVNPLSLHAPTPSFSAQGLSRTFAAAAETALRTGVALQIVECEAQHKFREHQHDEDVGMTYEDRDGEVDVGTEETESDPWEQEVSILNVSARRFGSAGGERAWAGRTVKARRIAARWFYFNNLVAAQT
ncbi:hypothetical protein FB567DRAFT_327255 [Paraphoma chrysanthemicola]|uniref:Uncharacterized protein n=1 Tax=Paraphoma chrysanthemicola TaxID=798071 RepID=A0A8K0RBS1_9PLEO|nr:hypothetical protein FB567DRAFT_327255 [Paraphoma chrysanthemicola]